MLQELLKNNIPKKYQDTIFIRLFGLLKVPLIFWVSPSVVKLNENECTIKIPFNRRTKNHLNSMYFGVLCTGADIAGGLVAMNEITASGKKIALAFKDFQANFLKRAEGDVHFSVTQIPEIKKLVADVIKSGERMNMPVLIKAYVPSVNPSEEVATFTLTLSLKLKS